MNCLLDKIDYEYYRKCIESVAAQIPDIPRCECGGFYHKVKRVGTGIKSYEFYCAHPALSTTCMVWAFLQMGTELQQIWKEKLSRRSKQGVVMPLYPSHKPIKISFS